MVPLISRGFPKVLKEVIHGFGGRKERIQRGLVMYPTCMNVVFFSSFFYTELVFASNVCSLVLEHLALFRPVLIRMDSELYSISFVGILTL